MNKLKVGITLQKLILKDLRKTEGHCSESTVEGKFTGLPFSQKIQTTWRNTMQTQNQTQYFAETADLFIPLSEDEQARVQGGGCDPDATQEGIYKGAVRGAFIGIRGGLPGLVAGIVIGAVAGGAVGCGVGEVAKRLPTPRTRYFA